MIPPFTLRSAEQLEEMAVAFESLYTREQYMDSQIQAALRQAAAQARVLSEFATQAADAIRIMEQAPNKTTDDYIRGLLDATKDGRTALNNLLTQHGLAEPTP